MKKIKALVFDVDGTLIPYGELKIIPSALQAINQLKAQGLKVIVATGRCLCFIQDDILKTLKPDFIACINGQSILDQDYKENINHTLIKEDLDLILEFVEKNDVSFALKYNNHYPVYNKKQEFIEKYKACHQHLDLVFEDEKRDYHLNNLPGGAFMFCEDANLVEALKQKLSQTKIVKAYDGAWDIYNANYNKATAIKEILSNLNIEMDEVMAFGDAENDVDMLKMAGISVCLGEGNILAKQAASYVTSNIKDDGIVKAIEYYKEYLYEE